MKSMSKEDWKIASALVSILFLLLLLVISIWIFRSYMEAIAFNRITNSDITTWEAMWVTLRVDIPIHRP